MSLLNFQTILVFFFRYEPGTKIENNSLKTDSYLKKNQFNLNADKTELLYFSIKDELEPKITFNGNLNKIFRELLLSRNTP